MNFSGIQLIEISGFGCAGCEELAPVAKSVADGLGLQFVRLEAQSCSDLIRRWEIERVPALVLADGEYPIGKCYGYQPEEILTIYLEDKLQEYRKENSE